MGLYYLFMISFLARTVLAQTPTQKGLLHCLFDDTNYMMVLVIHVNSDDVSIMYAVDPSGTKIDTCVSGINEFVKLFGTGTDRFYQVTVKRSTQGTFTTTDCGATQDTENGSPIEKFTWRFATRTKSEMVYKDLVFLGDMNYEATCDFRDMTNNLVLDGNINIEGQTSTDLVFQNENVEFTVWRQGDQSSTISSNLGDQIQLRMVLEVNALGENPTATGVSPFSCRACDAKECDSGDPTKIYELTDEDGCLVQNQDVGSGGTSFFTEDGNAASLQTAFFVNFVFSGDIKRVWFVCSIEYCFGTVTSKCSDRCLDTGRRKKRDVQLTHRNNATAGVPLQIEIARKPEEKRTTNSKEKKYIGTGEGCDYHIIFLGVTIGLGLLLVTTIGVTIRMACLLNRHPTNKSKLNKP